MAFRLTERTLTSGSHATGSHSLQWDGTDHSGTAAAQGFYLVRIQTDDPALSLPLVLTR
jgi:flagellar hook assembly protein FlgD